jgi:hypothetical protein
MVENVIYVSEGQEPADAGAWVVVRRIGKQYRVTMNDPRNTNPLTLSERFDSFGGALFNAEARAKNLGVPVHAVGCEDA